jgi:hypothetical protein
VLQRQQHQFHSRQVVRHRQHVRRISALRAPGLEPAALGTPRQHAFKEPRPGFVLQQSRAKFAQYRRVKPVIVQRQRQQIFPVQAAAHRLRRLGIAQVLGKL